MVEDQVRVEEEPDVIDVGEEERVTVGVVGLVGVEITAGLNTAECPDTSYLVLAEHVEEGLIAPVEDFTCSSSMLTWFLSLSVKPDPEVNVLDALSPNIPKTKLPFVVVVILPA